MFRVHALIFKAMYRRAVLCCVLHAYTLSLKRKSGGKQKKMTHGQRIDMRRRRAGGDDGGTSGGLGGLGQ